MASDADKRQVRQWAYDVLSTPADYNELTRTIARVVFELTDDVSGGDTVVDPADRASLGAAYNRQREVLDDAIQAMVGYDGRPDVCSEWVVVMNLVDMTDGKSYMWSVAKENALSHHVSGLLWMALHDGAPGGRRNPAHVRED